ncbi:MAG TPA: glucosyl transferase, partial [Ignavibacteriaceae bacterium]|nr:glucosyl transferase [Ignavibacteriaceae bacterium]
MKLLFISLAFGFSFLLLNSCHERGPLFPPPALGLGLRDFSCTEAWIEVQVGNNDKTANIYIKKNDEIIKTITLGQSDSLFYFDNLQPNTGYKFDAVTYDDGKEIKSNPVTFTTLDTTSHNFSWQTFEFGQHSSSVLYDVTIINENNIWAVGEIYMNDSLGNPDPNSYNAVHWDGQSWELKRIKTLF